MRVAVVGGGIAGLAAAWELRNAADVTLFEPAGLGGCIRTTAFLDHAVDEGPDAFITRTPEAVDLCRDAGIESELIAPAVGKTAIWWNGRLRRLPEGMVLGVPTRPTSIARTGLLSPLGAARAALDPVLPRRRLPESPTVRQVVASRFGSELADRLVDPLVGSIYAGSTAELGAEETVPQLTAALGKSRSLLLALRRSRGPGGEEPLFLAPRGGMHRLVDGLVAQMNAVEFIAERISGIHRSKGGTWVLEPGENRVDTVIVATPAHQAAALLGGPVGTELASWATASVVLVTAGMKGIELPGGLNGFLVPRGSGRLMTACSFGTNKWPHWADRGISVVRMSAGRYGDSRAEELDDDAVADRLLDELGDALGRRFSPAETRISRYPHSFPQYRPGHSALVAAVESAIEQTAPAVYLAGSSYRGIGIPACIASGRRAARSALQRVGART